MSGFRPQVPSLMVWLHSSSLLAVVAGYSVLLLVNQRMADWERIRSFRESSNQVLSSLRNHSASSGGLEGLLPITSIPGIHVTKASVDETETSAPIAIRTDKGQQLLLERARINLMDGGQILLEVKQDFTASIEQERLSFWILVAGAGVSSLVTSALLRPVLKRGLAEPLERFGNELMGINLPPTPGDALQVSDHPKELQPIASAFNTMHKKLWASWEQERIFTDGVAHELRTPITLISGHAQSLLRQEIPAEFMPSLQHIRSEAERMTSLISDLLDLARQDGGRISLERQAINADDILLLVHEQLSPKAPKRIYLDIDMDDSKSTPLGQGDPHRLQQCLTALVDNALRYSPTDGTVTLGSRIGGNGNLILYVRDQGPGVPEGEREQIFERFVRGSAATSHNTRGSGIGLAIVKLLMEAMGGHVVVSGAPGGGADFQLHLQPFKSSDPQLVK